ncbi:hypothetical protein RRG08_047650 [Elysia crispata]|uniref:Uncharacterized protein n=1 Tax=Elysia crispata TaxID=231223 RepID=A0AAE0ZW94_9GAST|nr:hypothetical protein RRG08_047650 [Elysia crispata]
MGFLKLVEELLSKIAHHGKILYCYSHDEWNHEKLEPEIEMEIEMEIILRQAEIYIPSSQPAISGTGTASLGRLKGENERTQFHLSDSAEMFSLELRRAYLGCDLTSSRSVSEFSSKVGDSFPLHSYFAACDKQQ